MRPHLQNNQSKVDWRCGPSGKAALCKHKVLNSNPNLTKKKKKDEQILIIPSLQNEENQFSQMEIILEEMRGIELFNFAMTETGNYYLLKTSWGHSARQ
jgi:hypothetical protein